MKGKILFVTGGMVGYVLGARAGRKRYEQIRSAASKIWERPAIQNQVHQAQDFAADKAAEVPDVLIEGARKVVSSLMKRARPADDTGSATGGAKTATSATGSAKTATSGPSGANAAATTPTGQPVVVKTTQTRASTPSADDAAE